MTKNIKTIALPLGLAAFRRLRFPKKLGILEKVYGSSLARFGTSWVNTSIGLDWKLDLTNCNHRWIVYGDYEGSNQMDWIRKWLSDGGNIIDSGSNIGQMLLYFLSCPNTRVYCVDPVPICIDWLKECVESGGHQDRVDIVQQVFDQSEGNVELKVAGQGESAEWSTLHTEWFQNLDTEIINCKATTFDSFLVNHAISSVRLWKLDVEGGEYRALLGANASLQNHVIEALLVEVHRDNASAVTKLLHGFGYLPYQIGSKGIPKKISANRHSQISKGNCLFLPT